MAVLCPHCGYGYANSTGTYCTNCGQPKGGAGGVDPTLAVNRWRQTARTPEPKKLGEIGYSNPDATPVELAHLYEGETDPLYQWPNPPRGELPW